MSAKKKLYTFLLAASLDERNTALRNRSKALSGDLLQWSCWGCSGCQSDWTHRCG